MMRSAAALLLLAACSSSSSSSSCPDVTGTWKSDQVNCDSLLAKSPVVITEKSCTLTFAAPFEAYSGQVTSDGKISVAGGGQSCSGTASSTEISMPCSPGTCIVTLHH